MSSAPPAKLTHRQQRFVAELFIDGIGAQAAIRAGYAPHSARITASQLLSNPNVAAAVRAERERRWDETAMTAAEIKAEASKIARFSMGKILFVTDDGDALIDLRKASPDDLSALSSVEVHDYVDRRERDADGNPIVRDVKVVKAKAHDKIAALTFMARIHRLLTDRVEVSASEDFAALMEAAARRAEGP